MMQFINESTPVVSSSDYIAKLIYLLSGRYHRATARLAADIGVSRQTVHAWTRGAKPSKRHAARIEALYQEVKQEYEKV